MAVAAARDALKRSGHRAEDIALLLHACVYFQGLELYPTASYIHREVLGDHSALAFEVKNASNGCMTALDIAARSLAATDDVAALVTTADKVGPPAIDRWNSDIGIVPGDGASAMVLSKRSGFAQVLSTSTVSDPTLERLHRGDAPFTPHHDPTLPIDLRLRKLQYLGDVELDEFTADSGPASATASIEPCTTRTFVWATSPGSSFRTSGASCCSARSSPHSTSTSISRPGPGAAPSATSARATRSPDSTTS